MFCFRTRSHCRQQACCSSSTAAKTVPRGMPYERSGWDRRQSDIAERPPTLATSATPGPSSAGGGYTSPARSADRADVVPAASTVYQKIWPRAVASGPSVGTAPAGSCLVKVSRSGRGDEQIEIDVVVEDDVDHREVEPTDELTARTPASPCRFRDSG